MTASIAFTHEYVLAFFLHFSTFLHHLFPHSNVIPPSSFHLSPPPVWRSLCVLCRLSLANYRVGLHSGVYRRHRSNFGPSYTLGLLRMCKPLLHGLNPCYPYFPFHSYSVSGDPLPCCTHSILQHMFRFCLVSVRAYMPIPGCTVPPEACTWHAHRVAKCEGRCMEESRSPADLSCNCWSQSQRC